MIFFSRASPSARPTARRARRAVGGGGGGPPGFTPVGLITVHSQCLLRWGILVSGGCEALEELQLIRDRMWWEGA
jgi:hypothetical protein